MSAIGTVTGVLGGPKIAALIVAGGLVAGSVGGVAVSRAGGSGTPATASGTLPVYPCPDTGPALLVVQGGQKLLVTGRTEDGAWLRIHLPEPVRPEGWVQASPLSVKGTIADLPVATCAAELAIGSPSLPPVEPLTAVQDNPPSQAPTTAPTGTPAPTPTPKVRPSLASLTASTQKISYDTGSYCPTAVKKVTFKVKATDASGIAGVTLYWREPGAAAYATSAMTRAAGTAKSGTWQATLDTTANVINKAGKLAFYAVATNTSGASRRLPTSGANTVTVAVCVNTGPTITSASSSSGSSLSWDPLGVAKCQTATNITAVVKDPEGVKSVTLFYRRPGSSTWSSKAMDNHTIPGKWYANLDTLGDKITIPKPPTGTLSWYVKAVDGKNVASKTSTRSITIRRCDTEATFFVNSVGTFYTFCPQPPTNTTSVKLQWTFSITDPDGLTSATISYKVVNRSGLVYSGSKTVKVTGQRFSMSSAALDGNKYYGSNSVTWTITTKDKYGGTSPASSKATVTISVC